MLLFSENVLPVDIEVKCDILRVKTIISEDFTYGY